MHNHDPLFMVHAREEKIALTPSECEVACPICYPCDQISIAAAKEALPEIKEVEVTPTIFDRKFIIYNLIIHDLERLIAAL